MRIALNPILVFWPIEIPLYCFPAAVENTLVFFVKVMALAAEAIFSNLVNV